MGYHSISPDYAAHGISAMESEVQTDILVGRPKGGVCTLINSRFSASTVNHICAERFVINSIGRILFINVYLPGTSTCDNTEQSIDILDDIFDICNNITYDYMFFGGDINCDLTSNSNRAVQLSDKITQFGLTFVSLILMKI